MPIRLLLAALMLLTAFAASAATMPSGATPFDGRIEKGTSGAYDIGGDRLAPIDIKHLSPGDFLSRDVFDAMTTSTVLGIYAATDLTFLQGVMREFQDISDGIVVAVDPMQDPKGKLQKDLEKGKKIKDAIWVLWEGTQDITFTSFDDKGKMHDATIQARVTRPGNPLEVAAVPLPAPAGLLLSGIAYLTFAGWRRRRAATS